MKKMLFKICLITLLVLCSLSLYSTTCMADSSLDDIMNNGNSFLNVITQSIEEKAKVKESMVPWIIGIIVSFGAFTIWEVAVNLFQSL